jgi:hypothetical protein
MFSSAHLQSENVGSKAAATANSDIDSEHESSTSASAGGEADIDSDSPSGTDSVSAASVSGSDRAVVCSVIASIPHVVDDDIGMCVYSGGRRAELTRAIEEVIVPLKAAALPYPSTLVPLRSDKGVALLEGSVGPFEALVEYFEGQGPLQCGVTSLTVALNVVLRGGGRSCSSSRFTIHELQEHLRDEVKVTYPFFSANLREIGALADRFALTRTIYASECDCDEFRRLAVSTLTSGGSVIANFQRAPLGYDSPFSGHCSPLGAYNPCVDEFLVMDVARKSWQPVWVPTRLLFDGMNTMDRPRDELMEFLTAVTTPWLGPDRLRVVQNTEPNSSSSSSSSSSRSSPQAEELRTRGFMLINAPC